MSKERKKVIDNGVGEVSVGAPPAAKAPLKRRKKGGCLKAFIITLCVTVGLLAVLIVGGLFIGDAVFKNNFGISLFDVFAVIGDVGDYDRDEIVTNPYSSGDVDDFYDNANAMLYFRSGEDAVLNSEYINEIMSEAANGGTDNLMASLLGILKSENFDAEKLGAYEGWKDDVDHVGELPVISDKQFAAFFDDLMIESGVLDGYMTDDFMSMLGGKQIKDLVSLEQLIVRKGADMSEANLAEIDGVADHVYMTLTVSLDLKETVSALLPSLDEKSGFPVSAFGWLIDLILPDMTYATATVDLASVDYGVGLELNSLAAEECEMGAAREEIIAKYRDADGKITKMDRLLIVVESLSGTDLRATVNESASGALGYLCKNDAGFSMGNAIDLATVTPSENGDTFKIDLYGMMTELLNGQTGGSAASEDIIVLMQALICTNESGAYADDYAHRADMYSPQDADLTAALAECGFDSIENVKTEEDYNNLKAAYGAIGYRTPGVDLTDGENVFEREFTDALAEAYCLDLNKYAPDGTPTGESYTFSEIAGLFGIASGDAPETSLELIDLLDGAKFAAAAGDPAVRKLDVTDRRLGAIMRALMPDYIGEAGYGDYGLELRTLKITQRAAADGSTHDVVTVVFTLKTDEMLKGAATDYIGGVIPQYIAMGVTVDMTPGIAAELRLPAEITCYNDITDAGSDAVLNGLTSGRLVAALERIVPDIDLDQLLLTMSESISSVVDNMTTVLPSFAFVPSADNSYSYAEFPSLFDLAAELTGLNDAEKPEADRIDGAELKNAVDYLVNYDYDASADVAPDADYDGFLSSVQQNYYLSAQLTDFDSIFTALGGSFDASVLRLNAAQSYTYGGDTVWYGGMMYDGRASTDLAVRIGETDLAAIMREFASSSLGEKGELVRAEVTADGIELYVRIHVSSMLEDKYRELIHCDYVYGGIAIDLASNADGTADAYDTVITVNGQGADGSDFDTLLRLIKAFGVGNFSLDEMAHDVGKAAYDALKQLKTARIDYSLDAESGEIVLPSFYDYAMTLIGVDRETYTADDMKSALQGIRARAVNTDTEKYYVNADGSAAAANAKNFDASRLIVNPLAADVDLDSLDVVSGSITDPANCIVAMSDNQLGRWIANTKRTGGDSLGEFAQLAALPAGEKNAAAAAVCDFASGFSGALSADTAYVTFTFRTEMTALFSAASSAGNLAGVLPDSVTMTLVYAYDAAAIEPLTFAHLRINGLTEKQQTLLIEEICNYADFDSNVRTHAADASGLIAGLGFAVDNNVPAGDAACGRLTLALAKLTTQV